MLYSFSSSLFANTTSQKIDIKDTVTAPNSDKALIAFNVGVDLSGIEQPATIAAESIEKMASSLQTMAEHPNLTPSQQQTVIETFQQIDTLTKTFNQSVAALPQAVAQTSQPIVTASKTVINEIKIYTIVFLL